MNLINKILERRRESVSFIQECFRQFLLRRRLVSYAKKHTKYYSVYPSRTDFEKISIKLYTNLKDPSQFVELPVRFCNKRNCYIFDIPKSKFPSKKKYMCFTFVLDDSTIVDSKYNCIFFGGRYVNQIDFNTIDKKESKLQKAFRNYMYIYKRILFKNDDRKQNNNKREYKLIDISNMDSDKGSPLRNNNNLQTLNNQAHNGTGQFLRSFTFKNPKRTFYSLNNNSTEPVNLNSSGSEDKSRSKKKKEKRNKSILKEHGSQSSRATMSSKSLTYKKVSFGWVETSE